MSHTAPDTSTNKPAKIPARLSRRRVMKVMEKLAGGLDKNYLGLPTIRIPGGYMSIDVNDERGGLCVLGYWGGTVCFDPDRKPLRMDINDLNGGGISGNVVAETCGSSQEHSHLRVFAAPYLPSTATNAQLKSIVSAYAKSLSEAFELFDDLFPEHPSQPLRGAALKPVPTHYFSEAYEVSVVGMWRVHQRATRLAMVDTPVYVLNHGDGTVSIIIDDHTITVQAATDDSGDIELSLVTPSGRCVCDLDSLVRWAELKNADQYAVSARIEAVHVDAELADDDILALDGEEDLVLVTTARIPTGWGYTDAQLDHQLSSLVSQLLWVGEEFYDTFNPGRFTRYVDRAA